MHAAVERCRQAGALFLAGLVLPAGGALGAPPDLASGPERIPVHVTVNTVARGEVFAWRDHECVWLSMEDLVRLGVPHEGAHSRNLGGRPHACVDRLDDVTTTLDEETLTLRVEVKPSRMAAQNFNLARSEDLPITPSTGWSGYINYGLTADHASGLSTYSARILGNLARDGWLLRTEHQAIESDGTTQWFRLQSFLQRDWPGPMLRFIAGDFDTAAGPLSRGYALGGVSFASAFDLRPGFVTSPTARITGIAATPSVAEIYVDGVLVATRNLQPGPYDFTNLEDFTGLRNVEVRIRDASGVRSVVRIPYYFTERLLAAGLTDFNVSWGAQRQSAFGDTYGTGAFSAFVHHGITDRVTIGAEAQASSGYAFAALAGAARFDRVGVFALDVGAQRLEDGDVHVADVFNWHYTRGGTTLRALTRGYGDGYRTSSAPPVPGALELPRREVALGWDEALYGSVLLSLNASERRFKVQATQRDYGASLSAGLRSWGNVIISAQRSCASHQCTTQAAASLSIPFGAHHSVNAGWRRDVEGANTTYLQASRSVPTGEGYGWRVNAQDSQGARDLAADGTLRLTQGVLTGAVRRTTFDDGSSSEGWSTGLEGSLACVGSSCYLTQPITDAFAVVDLNGVEGVRVSRNNEVIGRSGASGEVLVSSAPALTRNDIAIFDEDVPISIAVLRNTHLLVPAQGVGYRVRFDLRPILAIRGTLVREQEGRRVPIENVELIVRGEGADPIRARTAGAGFFEIDQLEAGRYVITADLTEGPCVVFVDVPPTRETVHRVGEIACEIVAY